jgi:DNA-binding PadR family transcriptional regulator
MSHKIKAHSKPVPLTPAVFYILLGLSNGERHGYELMKLIHKDSGGILKMGPGTLYGSIKRMLVDGLIAEAGERADSSDERRRYYRITASGRAALASELKRFAHALDAAQEKKLKKSKPRTLGLAI